LKGLRRTVRAAVGRAQAMGQSLPVALDALDDIKSIYQWDNLVVAPRFGYANADDYYAQCSAGPRLKTLRRPALVVAAQFDPMVPIETLRPYFDAPQLTVRTPNRGGHVGFPADLDLGFDTKAGLIYQTIGWFEAQTMPASSARSVPDVSLVGYSRSWRPK
jgi:predicted alpha/beta-fold hydrolase